MKIVCKRMQILPLLEIWISSYRGHCTTGIFIVKHKDGFLVDSNRF